MKCFRILSLLFILLCIASPGFGEEDKKFTVKLIVVSDDEEFHKLEATSFLKRELREIGDISIQEKGLNDFLLLVRLKPIETPNKEVIGLAIAYLIQEKIDDILISLNVRTGPEDALKEYCQSIVATLDLFIDNYR